MRTERRKKCVAKLESTTSERQAGLRDRALGQVVSNLTLAPLCLIPFAALVSVLTRADNDAGRMTWWIASSALSTVVVCGGVACYRRRPSGPTSRRIVFLLRAGLMSMGVMFGLTTWVASAASIEMVMLFGVFPTIMGAFAAMLTAGRPDMFFSLLVPMGSMSAFTLAASADTRLRGLALLWVFYAIALTVIQSTLTKTALKSIVLQYSGEDLLAEVEREQDMLTETNARLAASIEQLTHQATHDSLTGLLNRRGVFEELDALIGDQHQTQPVGVLFADLDHFKAVNDALGHRGGDDFLRIVADRIDRCVKTVGFAGRFGGDEFVIGLPGADEQSTVAVAHQLRVSLGHAVHAATRELPSSVSIGVAHCPKYGSTVAEALGNANVALYRAKTAGRGRVVVFGAALAEETSTRKELERRLRRAIEDGGIVPYFQPELDARTGLIVGAELLARWVQPDGTVIAAQEFIDVAVSAGLLERVTERVFGGARKQIRRLYLLGLPKGFRFRVNLAPLSTERPWRDNPIALLLHGIDPHLLTVDVRESFATVDLPAAAANLAEFRAQGGRVCLDDFTQGVSSLSMLRRLPLDEVRIDRVSIDTITTHPHDRAIVRSIIALTLEIGLDVSADGVETGVEADALIALGCVRQQGHLYSPALPAAQFEDYLLLRLADQYVQATDQRPTWNINELS